ncbi:hypothetical protein XU18_3115 [Perkinsela sp. CCAP 1560/4]|nr:hypothetical protein XU18_3115 [Perkinsela sp. CCAP 1560/4]|eukprot:KNH05953.1 hypothetical protein XU18_3115 [Perkinsela sp. CCAP 1560/4]
MFRRPHSDINERAISSFLSIPSADPYADCFDNCKTHVLASLLLDIETILMFKRIICSVSIRSFLLFFIEAPLSAFSQFLKLNEIRMDFSQHSRLLAWTS